MLIHLRGEVVRQKQDHGGLAQFVDPENMGMKALAQVFSSRTAYESAQKLGKIGQMPLAHDGYVEWLPGMLGGWTAMRDMQAIPQQTFREWWEKRRK